MVVYEQRPSLRRSMNDVTKVQQLDRDESSEQIVSLSIGHSQLKNAKPKESFYTLGPFELE